MTIIGVNEEVEAGSTEHFNKWGDRFILVISSPHRFIGVVPNKEELTKAHEGAPFKLSKACVLISQVGFQQMVDKTTRQPLPQIGIQGLKEIIPFELITPLSNITITNHAAIVPLSEQPEKLQEWARSHYLQVIDPPRVQQQPSNVEQLNLPV